MDWIVNMIRAGMRPGANTLAGKIGQDYNAAPAAPAAPAVPVATSETGVRSLERQMWPEFFDTGVPRSYALAEDPMTAGGPAPHSSTLGIAGAPLPPRRPQTRQAASNGAGGVPLPPPRPQAAPTSPLSPQQPYIPPSETAWIDPAILNRQNSQGIDSAQPQAAYASLNGSSGSSVSPPGMGLLGFLGSGAVPAYKQSALTPPDFQGPAPTTEMSGKRVGVVEGSMADQFQQSPVFKLMSLFGGGGFG